MMGVGYVVVLTVMFGAVASLPSFLENTEKRQSGCLSDELQCNDGTCYNAAFQCDAWPDCSGAEDDLGCGGCEADEFMCGDGSCIPNHWLCDGWNDCDGTDERASMCLFAYRCDDSQFRCTSSGLCIPGTWQCDGMSDCGWFGEDEAGCSSSKRSKLDGWTKNNLKQQTVERKLKHAGAMKKKPARELNNYEKLLSHFSNLRKPAKTNRKPAK